MAEVDDLKSTMAGIDERLARMEAAAVPLAKVQETVQAAVKEAAPQPKLPDPPDPKLQTLVERADTLVSLCDRYPELCQVLDDKKPIPAAGHPIVEQNPAAAHEGLLKALNEAGMQLLGRAPHWGDLLDLCPDGNCSRSLARSLLKRPEVLRQLLEDEEAAKTLIAILIDAKRLEAPPPPAPTPPEEVVDAGPRTGFFGRR